MLGRVGRSLVLAALIAVSGVMSVSVVSADTSAITYVSADAVYIGAGRKAGVQKGLVIEVVRDGVVVATLEVTHVSSHSSACKRINGATDMKAGDAVRFTAQPVSVQLDAEAPPARVTVAASSDDGGLRPRLRGYAAMQGLWVFDRNSNGLSSAQPSVNLRLMLDRVAGTRAKLRIRYRTSLYHRGASVDSSSPVNEWTNQLTELALVWDNPADAFQVGFGRVINPFFRGVGLMDGGYIAARLGQYFHLGIAAGTEPDAVNSAVRVSHPLAGAFVAFERRENRGYFGSTVALSGSYAEGVVSREFIYVQNAGSLSGLFSFFQSVEIDVNRQWRMDAEGSRFSFTNFYIMGQVNLTRFVLFDMSYDDRNNVRDFYSIATPDSLFELGETRGYTSNVTFYFPRRSSLRVGGGFRVDDNGRETNRFLTITGRVARLPWQGHMIVGRFAYSETPYIIGYRPAVTYQFPLTRSHRVSFGGGAYVYEQDTVTSQSYYGEAMDTWAFRTRYRLSLSARQYFGDDFESFQAYTELGMDF